MNQYRSINQPIRRAPTWMERWCGEDAGLIACWERGRETQLEAPLLAEQAANGQLIVLPWKGGVEKHIKAKKFGSFFYLAMWRGLRNEDLNIDITEEVILICSVTGMKVVFTSEIQKFRKA